MKSTVAIICVLLVFAVQSVLARPNQNGTVEHLQIHNSDDGTTDVVLVRLSGTMDTEGLSCITKDRWYIDLTDESAKSILAVLIAAQSQTTSIEIQGNYHPNTCGSGAMEGFPVIRNVIMVP